jgi:hypothetical protein
MIHVRVRQQHGVYPREVVDTQARVPLPSKHNQPLSKHRIDEQRATCRLNKKRRMPNKGNGRLGRGDHRWFRLTSSEWLRMTLAHQAPELPKFSYPERNLHVDVYPIE